jgi:3-oxoacyl-[acyl-carrier protein] reductase
MMQILFADKLAIVTGAARGIGREIALSFAHCGANLALMDIEAELLEQTRKEVEETGVKCMDLKVDVANYQEVSSVVKLIFEKFGRIDILVNNAGITKDGLLPRLSEEDWDRVLSVNLKGAFNCIKAVSRYMLKAHQGKIINIASIAGMVGNPGQANYASSKGALLALTKTVAKEFSSRGINVNAIAPGFIETAMTESLPQKDVILQRIPLGRFGKPQDIANLVLFLASEFSSYITGQIIVVDGGMVM